MVRSGARIDLLISDVGLPGGMNGRQVANAGRVLRPGLKVLFITSTGGGRAASVPAMAGRCDPNPASPANLR